MTLKDLIEQLEQFVDDAIANDGDMDITALEGMMQEKADKIDAYGYAHERLSAEIAGAKAQLDYIKEKYETRLRQLENSKLRLEQRLVGYYQQELLGDKEKGNTYRLQFRNYPIVRLNIPAEDLPDEFKTVKTEVKPKLSELKKAIKEDVGGRTVIGFMAELEDNHKAHFKLN